MSIINGLQHIILKRSIALFCIVLSFTYYLACVIALFASSCALTQTSSNYLDTRMHILLPSISPLTNSYYIELFLFQNINLNVPDLHESYIASCISNWAEFTDISTSRVLMCLL